MMSLTFGSACYWLNIVKIKLLKLVDCSSSLSGSVKFSSSNSDSLETSIRICVMMAS